MKKMLTILLAALLTILACTVTVYADDDESDDADESGEADSGGEGSDDDDNKNSTPGFELTFAAVALLAAKRIRACLF
jgi:Spy/CpxP family protein refolding chaperone